MWSISKSSHHLISLFSVLILWYLPQMQPLCFSAILTYSNCTVATATWRGWSQAGQLSWAWKAALGFHCSELAGLELAARLHVAVNKTKPSFTKAVAACLGNLLMSGHLWCWSSKEVVAVLLWQCSSCSSCWLQEAAYFLLFPAEIGAEHGFVAQVLAPVLQGFCWCFTLSR